MADPLAALGFLSGGWRDQGEDGAFSEEFWSAPEAGCLVGSWRLVVDGQPRLFELLTIIGQDDGRVVLTIRHQRPDGTCIEEQARPLRLDLLAADADEAVFGGPAVDGPDDVRIAYRRAGDALHFLLQREGKQIETTFARIG